MVAWDRGAAGRAAFARGQPLQKEQLQALSVPHHEAPTRNLTEFLVDNLGFMTDPVDRCAFRLFRDGGTVIVLAHVDDLLVLGTEALWLWARTQLASRFPITEGGSDYLGIEYEHTRGRVHVHQATYSAKVATRYGYASAHAPLSPLPNDWTPANSEPSGAGGSTAKAGNINFKSALGAIGYLATCTIPCQAPLRLRRPRNSGRPHAQPPRPPARRGTGGPRAGAALGLELRAH